MSQHPDHMQARMPGREDLTAPEGQLTAVQVPKMSFRIEVPAADGTPLLTMYEDDRGRLEIEYDAERVTEGAMRFLDGLRQWSGQVGIRWQSEVEKSAGS